jgi:protein phosphatase
VPLRLEYSSALDVGRARHNNEDAVLIDPSLGLCILADGMGGYNAGEVASDMATKAMRDTFRQWLLGLTQAPAEAEVAQALVAAAQEANRQVFTAANTVAAYAGMGTTLVAAVFERQHVWIGHLGDSRRIACATVAWAS